MKKILLLLTIIGLTVSAAVAYADEPESDGRRIERQQQEGLVIWNKYQKELETASDRVAIALRMLREDKKLEIFEYCQHQGMAILARNWDDDRSEPALKEFVENNERRNMGCGHFTIGAEASAYLQFILAKKANRLLSEKGKPADIAAAIREFFAKYQHLAGPFAGPEGIPNEDWELRKEYDELLGTFVQTVISIDGEKAIDLVIMFYGYDATKFNNLIEFVGRYLDAALVYARQIGPRHTSASGLASALAATKDEKAAVLFEEWLNDNNEWDTALLHLSSMPEGKQRLLKILGINKRLDVVSYISSRLSYPRHGFNPDRVSLNAIKEARDRLKSEGKEKKELAYLNELIEHFEQMLDGKENGGK